MPRYEFSEGSANKFWAITLSGKGYTATYGKIGSNGQTTLKTFDSDAEAKNEYDKIIAEKVKKGYALVGGESSGAAAAKAAPPAAKAEPAKAAPAKAAPAKAAPAKAAPAPAKAQQAEAPKAAGTPGARYFEFSEGSSNKFWEIALDDTNVRTRYGKIGTPGQATEKEFDSKSEAFKELDRLIDEKTKKGYAEKGGGDGDGDGAAGGGDARNPALEKAILANPYDKDAYSVFADWLQEQGDPRGELMALQLAGKDKPAQAMIDKQADYFLGPLSEHLTCYDGDLGNNNRENAKQWVAEARQTFLWKNGFIHRLRLAHDSYADEEFEGKLADVAELTLRHPSGRFLVELSFNSNGDPNEDNLDDLLTIFGKKAPATVRKIRIGDNVDQISWYKVGKLGKLWKGVPNLQDFEIEAGEFDVGDMDLPLLERAIFKTGGLAKSSAKAIVAAKIPKIKHLEIYFGTEEYGGNCSVKEVVPLLARTDLPSLTYLGLKNSEFTNDIANALIGAKILKQLKTLDLSLGTLTDDGAAALVRAKAELKHLDVLDLTHNYLTKDGVSLVKSLAKKVITDDQQKADESSDGEKHYYVAITE